MKEEQNSVNEYKRGEIEDKVKEEDSELNLRITEN